MAALTWLGHAAFRFDTGRKEHLRRPIPEREPEVARRPSRARARRYDRGHARPRRPVGDTVELSKKHGCTVVARSSWPMAQDEGSPRTGCRPNKGGTVEVGRSSSRSRTRTTRAHNGRHIRRRAVRLRLRARDGTKLYFAGDTCVFGDMQLIRRLYEPDAAILPIGDHYTMGPREAAPRARLLGRERCVPCHWGRSRL